MKISVKATAFAFGLTWALGVLLLGLMSIFGWGQKAVEVLGSIYLGYQPTVFGSLIGAIWAFVDGFLGGLVFAWLYHKLLNK